MSIRKVIYLELEMLLDIREPILKKMNLLPSLKEYANRTDDNFKYLNRETFKAYLTHNLRFALSKAKLTNLTGSIINEILFRNKSLLETDSAEKVEIYLEVGKFNLNDCEKSLYQNIVQRIFSNVVKVRIVENYSFNKIIKKCFLAYSYYGMDFILKMDRASLLGLNPNFNLITPALTLFPVKDLDKGFELTMELYKGAIDLQFIHASHIVNKEIIDYLNNTNRKNNYERSES